MKHHAWYRYWIQAKRKWLFLAYSLPLIPLSISMNLRWLFHLTNPTVNLLQLTSSKQKQRGIVSTTFPLHIPSKSHFLPQPPTITLITSDGAPNSLINPTPPPSELIPPPFKSHKPFSHSDSCQWFTFLYRRCQFWKLSHFLPWQASLYPVQFSSVLSPVVSSLLVTLLTANSRLPLPTLPHQLCPSCIGMPSKYSSSAVFFLPSKPFLHIRVFSNELSFS